MGNARPDNSRLRTEDIPDLLHDAQFLTARWKPKLAQVSLLFDCLRRNTDGSQIADRTVEIRLNRVHRIAAYYDPANIEVRPSRFRLDRPFSSASLQDWSYPPSEACLSINSQESLFAMTTSWRIDWLEGTYAKQAGDPRTFSIHLYLDQYDHGEYACERCLYFECEAVDAFSSGVALDLDEWGGQFDAWWDFWEAHVGEIRAPRGEGGPAAEDRFIPAGEDPPPDLSYEPPDQPAFLVLQTDAPPELLGPIQGMIEGIMRRDWARLAQAWPDYDKSAEDRARELEELYLGPEFGRWTYVRQVDAWWEEGSQACVTVRGIEHTAPDHEDPAANQETVISFALRKSDHGWRILTFAQGWPEDGSADQPSGPKPWLDEQALQSE